MQYDVPGFIYAALVVSGGALGFIRRGSAMSLVMGGSTGALAAYGAWRTSLDPNDVRLSLGVAVFLALLMGYRFAKSRKFMPAGVGQRHHCS
ncbi:Transmembrane protein 14A [Cryptotrichosporon argae]